MQERWYFTTPKDVVSFGTVPTHPTWMSVQKKTVGTSSVLGFRQPPSSFSLARAVKMLYLHHTIFVPNYSQAHNKEDVPSVLLNRGPLL